MKMKLQQAIAAAIRCLVPSALAASQTLVEEFAPRISTPGEYVGNSIWLFGTDGVYAFSPDGTDQRAHVPGGQVCGDPATYQGPSYRYCRFNDVLSDGRRFVWAGGPEGVSVFDIATGGYVGTYDSCKSPRDLEFHALRDEMWVRCSEVEVSSNSTDPTHLDVLSASDPGRQIQTDILLKPRARDGDLLSNGHAVFHHALGDAGYLTDNSDPRLFKIDLGAREVADAIELRPAAHGLSKAAYSPLNGLIFVRALVCCTCGWEDADVESCGRAPGYPVNLTTGPSAGMTGVTGLCGRSCAGVEGVDTVGVYEFDTLSGRVVATHALEEGIGGEPYASPDGRYVVLAGKNGGRTVRVLEAGPPGAPSATLVDLELGFSRKGYEDQAVARDLAFAEVDGATYLVVPSGTEHKVGIADLSGDGFDVRHVAFSDLPFENRAPHGRYRDVEWAVGTPYVWTNDSAEDEHYVIDVVRGELVNTITGIESSVIVSVQNLDGTRGDGNGTEDTMAEVQAVQANAAEEVNMTAEVQAVQANATEEPAELWEDMMAEAPAMKANATEEPTELWEDMMAEEDQANATEEPAELWEDMMAEDQAEESASMKKTSAAALVPGACAVLVGLANLYV